MFSLKKMRKTVGLIVIFSFIMVNLQGLAVFAQQVADPEKYAEKIIEYLQNQDYDNATVLIKSNPELSKAVFEVVVQNMDKSIKSGTPLDDNEMQIYNSISMYISGVFLRDFNDSSLLNTYQKFLSGIREKKEKIAKTGNIPIIPPVRPFDENDIDGFLDYYEWKLARVSVTFEDTEDMNRIKDLLKNRKDYVRLIRFDEMQARFLENVGFYNKAIEFRIRILNEYLPQLNDKAHTMREYLRLANVYYKNNDYVNAMKFFEKAYEEGEKGDEDIHKFSSFLAAIGISNVCLEKSNWVKFEQTIPMLDKSSDRFGTIEDNFEYDTQDFFLLLFVLNRFGEVLREQSQFLEKQGKEKESKDLYTTMENFYNSLYEGVTEEEAEEDIRATMEKVRMTLVILRMMGIMERDRGNYEEAAKYFTDINQSILQFPPQFLVFEDHQLMGICMLESGRTAAMVAESRKSDHAVFKVRKKQAIDAYLSANIVFRQISDNIKLIESLLELTQFRIENQDLSKPENRKAIESELAEIEKIVKELNSMSGMIGFHGLNGMYAEKLGKKTEARDFYILALTELENLISFMSESIEERNRLMEFFEPLYKKVSELSIEIGQPEIAFEILERSKASQFVNSINLGEVKVKDEKVQEALGNIAEIRVQSTEINKELEKEESKPEQYRDKKRIKELTETLATNKSMFYSNINTIRNSNPEYERLVAVKPAGFSRIQKYIPDNAVLIQYFPSNDKLYIFLITNKSFTIKTVEVGKSEVEKLIKIFRDSINMTVKDFERGVRPESIENWAELSDNDLKKIVAALSRLEDYLVEPIIDDISDKEVLAIIPTDTLYYLPFHALAKTDENGKLRFLIEEKQVVYLTSADILDLVKDDRRGIKSDQLIYAFGNPDGTLESSSEEVREIGELLPKTVIFLGDKATKNQVKMIPDNLGILHLATHGILDGRDVNNSYLVFAGSGDQGKLKQGEIFELPLQHSVLVTLSACQTALGESTPGSEIASLASAFSIAGAPSILASLWPVSDDSTRIFMIEFYKNLKEGKSKAQAIQSAQLKLMRDPQYAHPFYWSPFIMMGNWK